MPIKNTRKPEVIYPSKKKTMTKLIKFAKSIALDNWTSNNGFFEDEAEFRRSLIVDYDTMNTPAKDEVKVSTDSDPLLLLNQDEVVIPAEKAFIMIDVESVYAFIPIWAAFPRDGYVDKEKDCWTLNRDPKAGITRGYLQWQLSNALSGLPLFDHCFVEGLYFNEMLDDMPNYKIHMGS
jgi:hypothetical protein